MIVSLISLITKEREREIMKNILPNFCSPFNLEQNFQHSNPVFSWNKNKIKSVPNCNKSVQGQRILGYSFNQQWNKTFQNFLSNKIKHLTQKEMPIKHKFYSFVYLQYVSFPQFYPIVMLW